jgi:flagellar biosynthetic protein FliQ
MTPELVMSMGRHAIEVTLLVSAPLLLTALVVGLIISIFQAATQINEATLSFIPKLLGIFVVLIVAGPWILSILTDYLRTMLTNIPNLVG